MSDGYEPQQISEGLGAVENGSLDDGNLDNKLVNSPDSEGISVVQVSAPQDEESNRFVDSHPSIDNSAASNGGDDSFCGPGVTTEQSSAAEGDDQEPFSEIDAKTTEDAAKEDMFVDAPDELTGYDAKNAHNREVVAAAHSLEGLNGIDNDMQEAAFSDNGMQVRLLMDEVEALRSMLENTVGEKERITQEQKEEREALMVEVVNLHHQLKRLTEQQPFLVESGGGLVDQLHKEENGDGVEQSQESNVPLHYLVSECTEFLKRAVAERSQSEGTMREIHAILFMKDEEIENLNAKVTELSVLRDLVASSNAKLEAAQNIEIVTDRMLSSLAVTFNQGELFDESLTGKMSHLEEMTSMLIERYNQFVFESSELRQKELDLVEKLSYVEDENRRAVELLHKSKEVAEMETAELGKTRTELEQEKNRCANVREKLTLAVTKGKALVQQRDSLRQALADKTSELEKCMIELQEKSSALEAAELSKVELIKSDNLVASLKETLLQKDATIEEFEEILSQTAVPEGLLSANTMERFRWLVDDRNILTGVSVEFHKIRDVISSLGLPEDVASSNLVSQISWLGESFFWSRDKLRRINDEVDQMREAAYNQIDCLTAALSTEIQEKVYLQKELEELTRECKEVAEREHQVSLEKDQIVRMLIEASGSTMDDQGMVYQTPSDLTVFIDGCFQKIKEQGIASSEISSTDAETFEKIRSLLYVKDQELSMCEKILEEEMLDRSKLNHLSKDLEVASRELLVLKDENINLLKDFERSEDKSALLREKLSMAVKKGKGLVQERENLKAILDERKTEIENLRIELQQQESTILDCRNHMHRLSNNVECIPKLEADLVAMKDQRDQLEQYLAESNNMLQRVIGSIDSIVLPVNSIFEEPVEKVKWLAEYFSECQLTKAHVEEELGRAKEEANNLSSILAEAKMTIKSLEEALSISEDNVSRLAEERRELEVSKANIEQQLQTEIEEANSHAEQELGRVKEEANNLSSILTEAKISIKSLEDALSVSEGNVSRLAEERRELEVSKANIEQQLRKEIDEANSHAEQELGRVKEESNNLSCILTEAKLTIKSLEDALSVSEDNVSRLAEERRELEVSKGNIEQQLQKAIEEANCHAEQELGRIKEEVITLACKLAEANKTINSLEVALSVSENKVSQLEAEREELEVVKTDLEDQLWKAVEETHTKSSKMSEVSATRKSLEDALSLAKDNISVLSGEKEDAQAGRAAAEMELDKLREEVTIQTSNLTEAYETIKSLENALSHDRNNLALLAEERKDAEVGRINLEDELKKLTEEVGSQFGKLTDAQVTIRSLEDALFKAESNISVLVGEKNVAEQEILTLSSKLNACIEELVGTRGSSESKFQELFDHLNSLQMLMKDDVLLSSLRISFEKKFKSLKDMDHLLKNTRDHLVDKGSGWKQNIDVAEIESYWAELLSDDPINMLSGEMAGAGGDDISSHFAKTLARMRLRNKILVDEFEGFSAFMDDFIASLLRELQEIRDQGIVTHNHMESLKQSVQNMEVDKHDQGKTVTMLKNDLDTLFSSCSNAYQELQYNFERKLPELDSIPELKTVNCSLVVEQSDGGEDETDYQERHNGSQCIEMAKKLSSAVRNSQALTSQFEKISKMSATIIEDLQTKLLETQKTSERVLEESNLNQQRIFELESDVEALQSSCADMENKLGDYQVREDQMKDREAELSSSYNCLLQQKEAEGQLLSASQLKMLFDKINEITIHVTELEVEGKELQMSAHAKKLFYIIDSVPELHHQINLLSHDKEELQSNLRKQVAELKQMKEEVETSTRDKQELEKFRRELLELAQGLDKLIQKLGSSNLVGEKKSAQAGELLVVLEKLVTSTILESEDSKSEVMDLSARLCGSQKLVDELSTKVKLLEDSIQGRAASPEIVQERSIYEASSMPSGSEISEIEDVGAVGTTAKPPAPTAAHVRTMRKGSSEHLALNIDLESNRLINTEETDEDKGHLFKSLNTTGLIPKQGKMFADRIDGIWVSGGRVLMSRPRARLGLVAYWLLLHMWLLGTLL